jgi:hypothetical protein
MNFIDALSAARRKSILTGQPLTNQEISGLSSGYFDAAANTNTENRALAISEKNAADALAMERYNTEQQIEAAKKTQETQLYGNILQTGATGLGMNYMTAKPGESLIAKGAGLIKDVGGNILNYGKDLLGMGSETIPTFTEALTPALVDATGTGAGVSFLPGAGGAIVPDAALTAESGIGGVAAKGGAELAADVGTEAGGSILGTIGEMVGSVRPYAGYYGLAKGAGSIINMITDNNPGLKETPFGRLGGSLKEPLAVEQYWGDELADHGIGNPRTNEIVADVLNPIGGLITDTENTAKMFATGGISNINSDTNVPAAILTGGLSAVLGTWICTATAEHSLMTDDEENTMKKLRKYASENHKGWWHSYFKHGTVLVVAIAERESDLPKFYGNIRKILVEPVVDIFDTDNEAAFQIYLFVTQTLFKAYMPEFTFEELTEITNGK